MAYVLIDAARLDRGAADYLEALGEWSVSVITAMELIVGARNKHEILVIDKMVAGIPTPPLVPSTGTTAYSLLKRFARSHGLGVFDSLIAATALEEGLVLVTKNRKHFSMIPDLTVEVPQY